MRQALTIGAIVIVLGGLGVWVYFSFFRSQAGIVVAPTGTTSLPGAGQATTPSQGEMVSPTTTTVTTAVGARLVKISAGPVVPSPIVYRSTSTTTPGFFVNYIERQSGNVFSYSSVTRSSTRISNKTVPGIQSAVWLPSAQTAFVRYLSGTDSTTINTYALNADGSDGFFLEQNLADIAVSSTSILTLASGVTGSIASTRRTDGTRSVEVFSSPLSSLRVALAGKNRYFAFTNPSSSLGGAVFLVDGAGRLSHIAGPLNGLVALPSPSGATVLVSYVVGGAMQMELVNTATGAVTQLPVATITDKCVWTADNSAVYCGIPMNPPANYTYPDDWYQSAVSFSDRLWKINVAGRYAELVLDFSRENNLALDAVALSIDSAGTALSFINKIDGSLWVYSPQISSQEASQTSPAPTIQVPVSQKTPSINQNTPSSTNNSEVNTPPVSTGAQTNNQLTPNPTTSVPSSVSVNIQGSAFNPSTLTIKKDTKVTWTNNDSVIHTVTSDSGNLLNSPTLSPGTSFSFTFANTGSLTYHCAVHPTMKSTIIVEN